MRSNEDWIQALSGTGEYQDEAINDLRHFLLQVALYTLNQKVKDIHALSHSDRLALGEDCAQEACITVLNHLAEFKGESKFTTWAYKFAVNVSLARARQEGWKQISLELSSSKAASFGEFAAHIHSNHPDVESQVLQTEIIAVLDDTIQHDLTDKQRMVFRLIVFEQVPMDGVVQRMGMNRNAVYKLLHEARKKLKRAVQAHGFEFDETFLLFSNGWGDRFHP